MLLADRIKFEAFIAFCHTRFTDIGQDKGDNEETIFKDDKDVDKLNKMGNPIIKYLSDISTLESLNKKITNSNSTVIANLYHDNYKKLLNIMEEKIKDGDEIVSSVLGIGMLIAYMENDKFEKNIDVDLQELISILEICEKKSNEHRKIIGQMLSVAAHIVDKYWEKPKRKFKKRK